MKIGSLGVGRAMYDIVPGPYTALSDISVNDFNLTHNLSDGADCLTPRAW